MYRLNRFNSANHLVALFAAAATTYPKSLLRSIPICYISGRSAAETAGIGQIRERKMLPPELSRSVVMLTCESAADGGVCDVYLVGTYHRCSESCRDVKAVIQFVKPQVVFLELCPNRAHILRGERVKIDARVAYDEARRYGAKVMLGDRPFKITMQRVLTKAGLWEFCAYFFQGRSNTIKDLIEKGKVDADSLNLAIREITNMYPTWGEAHIHERDRYMSAKLLEIARKHNSVVAVVGKGHLSGIQKNWKQPVDMKQLLHVPIENKIILSSLRIGAVVAIISGIYLFINK